MDWLQVPAPASGVLPNRAREVLQPSGAAAVVESGAAPGRPLLRQPQHSRSGRTVRPNGCN